MVSFWPWKSNDSSPASFERALSALTQRISQKTATRDTLRTRSRRTKAIWTLYASFVYIVFAIISFLVKGRSNWASVDYTGVAGGPILIFLVRWIVNTAFEYRVSRVSKQLEQLFKEREKTIERLKAATKYNSTQQLLDKYGGSTLQSTPGDEGPRKRKAGKTPTGNEQSDQKQPERTGFAPPPTANIPRNNIPQGAAPPSPPVSHSPPAFPQTPKSGPPSSPNQYSSPQAPPSPDSPGFAPNAFGPPPSYSYDVQPHWYDRVFDVLLGEDETSPKNRFPLICKECRLVNGQAPPGARTLEEVGQWRCAACNALNGEQSEAKKILDEVQQQGSLGNANKRKQAQLDKPLPQAPEATASEEGEEVSGVHPTFAASGSRHEEHQYLDLIRHILAHGEHRPDRTGTGTKAVFAPPTLKFSLSRPTASEDEFEAVLPLLTTKRVFLRAVVAELLWFISASTSSIPLSEQGIKIWDGNGSREYLDSVGLTEREVGDLGPVYGFQWRHFGAKYVDAHTNYNGQGVDQLAEVIDKLRNKPHDRRIVLSAWNPADIRIMALPPCHMFAQFYVSFPGSSSKGMLHCQLYQRSCDMGLGVPFNIASYALLTHMLAHVCDLTPGSFTHVMGDSHVYVDHVEALKTQLERDPKDFPTLRIERNTDSIDDWSVDDFDVVGYQPHKTIAMKMSV